MTFIEYTRSFPPILCRILSKRKLTAIAEAVSLQRAAASVSDRHYLTLAQIESLSQQTDWERTGLMDCFAFIRGCGVDFNDAKQMRRTLDYLRKNPNLEYLRTSGQWESYYLPLLIRWRKSLGQTPPDYLHPYVKALAVRLTPIIK